jgi:hypothetical protein
MWIYDRWGNEIFHTKDANKGCDGTNKSGQELTADVFVYKIKYSFSENEKVRTITGHVTYIK